MYMYCTLMQFCRYNNVNLGTSLCCRTLVQFKRNKQNQTFNYIWLDWLCQHRDPHCNESNFVKMIIPGYTVFIYSYGKCSDTRCTDNGAISLSVCRQFLMELVLLYRRISGECAKIPWPTSYVYTIDIQAGPSVISRIEFLWFSFLESSSCPFLAFQLKEAEHCYGILAAEQARVGPTNLKTCHKYRPLNDK